MARGQPILVYLEQGYRGWYNRSMFSFRRNSPNNRWIRTIFLILSIIGVGLLVWSITRLGKASIIIEWSTASESDTVGYNLYRSQSADGEYTRINKEIIPSKGNSLSGAEYKYYDNDVSPGKPYYYLLEDIDQDGSTHQNGPIHENAATWGWLELILSIVYLSLSGWGVFTFVKGKKDTS